MMKRFMNSAAMILALTLTSAAEARDTVIGLSSAQSPDALKHQAERILSHLLDTLEPGETARFYDATAPALLGVFKMPHGEASIPPKRALNSNRDVLTKLGTFVRGAEAIPGHIGRIDAPGFQRLVRESAPAPEGGADMILLGHPVHVPDSAPYQSMQGGRVPSDGHIAATAGQSVYGTHGLSGMLAGYDVYFGLLGDPWSVSPAHAHYVTRFLSVSAEAHGASMAYIGSDLETLFEMAGHDVPDRTNAEPMRPDEKREMLSFAPDTGTVPDLYALPVEEEPAPTALWQNAQGVTIGTTWEVNRADLDLYVRPTPRSSVIYYHDADTAEGRLFKDFTTSPGNGFETVALTQAVDLSGVQIAVNYYGGTESPSGVLGELRIAIGTQVWAAPMRIAASKGNQGQGADTALLEGVAPNDAWVVIDPMAVVVAE